MVAELLVVPAVVLRLIRLPTPCPVKVPALLMLATPPDGALVEISIFEFASTNLSVSIKLPADVDMVPSPALPTFVLSLICLPPL